jgi:hypothetical protein
VDVADFAAELGFVTDVAVEATAGLPEAGRAVGVGNAGEDRSVKAAPACDDSLGERELEREQGAVQRAAVGGPHEEVQVLGHDDPGEELEAVLGSGRGEAVEEKAADDGVGEEREAVVAGEGDEAGVPGELAALHPLADGGGGLHGGRVLAVGGRCTGRDSTCH